ncbi:MAG: hypothetical protein M1133_16325 [Armatimonadetes bacterium]|nr:hypothetical protein [Armatimonadota bacterium]
MNVFRKAWRWIKGGRTDAQTVFGLLIAVISSKQRTQLRRDLYAVRQAVEIASLAEPNSTQVIQAREWVDGALEVLD